MAACALLLAPTAIAGVTAERTRVVFHEADREASLLLVNQNPYPILTQVWVDDGALAADPSNAQGPLLPLPPIFRMAPGEQRSLRFIPTGDTVPPDRESLYWLNIYEIPPQPTDTSTEAQLTVTLRTQMKVFYRPRALRDESDTGARQLMFEANTTAPETLRIINPSPYFITLTGVQQRPTAQPLLPAQLIAPFTQRDVPLVSPRALELPGTLEYGWIDDGGNAQRSTFDLR